MTSTSGLLPEAIRTRFPGLSQEVNGKPLAYLDNAATAQKPQAVIEAMRRYYALDCANVHRGVHVLSLRANEAYESARDTIADWLGIADRDTVVFTRGTTESVNLVAQAWAEDRITEGDEVLVTELEHHSNFVPWFMLCERRKAHLKVVPLEEDGSISLEAFRNCLSRRTRLAAFAHVSNALGTVLPVREMIRAAHDAGVPCFVDGAQSLPHMRVNLSELEADFYTFSGHKLFGPTGIGVLSGTRERMEEIRPWQGGGDMIQSVSLDKVTYNDLPWRLEAGTPHIAGVIGLAAAIKEMSSWNLEAVAAHEHAMLAEAEKRLERIPRLNIIGRAAGKVSVLSFVVDGAHHGDIATLLDMGGVAVRSGHHCAQPVMERYSVAGTVRASFAPYNTMAEVDQFVQALEKALRMLGPRS